MRYSEFEMRQYAPHPLDGAVPDASQHQEWNELVQSRDYDQIYRVWRNSDTTASDVRDQAVAILTRPQEYELPYDYPKESIGRLLSITEEIEGEETASLRRRLESDPEIADELAEGIISWYTHSSNLYRSDKKLASLQLEYQQAILELLPVVSSVTRHRLSTVYPSVESLAARQSLTDFWPTAELIKDTEIPPAFRTAALDRWLITTEPRINTSEQDAAFRNQSKAWLAQFAEEWSQEESANPEYITKIIRTFEHQARQDPQRAYLRPDLASAVARHLPDENLRYDFVMRHVMETAHENVFSIQTAEDEQLLLWLEKRNRALYTGRHILNFGKKPKKDNDAEAFTNRIEQLWDDRNNR